MLKHSILAVALVVCACKDKAPAKQAAKATDNAAPTVAPLPVDKLVDNPVAGPRVSTHTLRGIVVIAADGSLQIRSAKGDAATKLESLAKDLDLPEVAKRKPAAFAVEAGSGSAEDINPIDAQTAALGHPEPASGVPVPPVRATTAFAIAHPHDVDAGIVVLADATAPATALVDVLAATGGFIAVKRGPELGALPFAFDRQEPPFAPPTRPWLELQLGKPSNIQLVPGPRMPSDMNDLGEIIKTAKVSALDILVAPDSKVADLVGAIELARKSGIAAIGLGRVVPPTAPDASSRQTKGHRLLAWDFFMQNQDKTDVTPFRAAFDATLAPIHACYEKQTGKSTLDGTAKLEMLVETTGKVADLQLTGVPKPLATCVGDAMKAATFPPVASPVKVTARLAFAAG